MRARDRFFQCLKRKTAMQKRHALFRKRANIWKEFDMTDRFAKP